MRFKEGSRFLLLTAGVFCLMLGIAVLSFSMIEWVFFQVQVIGQFIAVSAAAILVGIALMHAAVSRARTSAAPPMEPDSDGEADSPSPNLPDAAASRPRSSPNALPSSASFIAK